MYARSEDGFENYIEVVSLPSRYLEIKMLFVVEMIMLMVGIRVLVKGTLPSIPFVRPRYKLGKHTMKLLGAVLILPIPLTVIAGLLLRFVLREASLGYDVALDWIIFAGAITATFIIIRRMWRP